MKGLYEEDDEPNPINHYGVTKLEGEKQVSKIAEQFCIVRPSVIYGAKPASGKENYALWILENLKNGKPVNVVEDQWNSPTLNTNLAEMILEVAERKLTGLYHLAGAARVSRYEFAKLIAQTFNLNQELIKPIRLKELSWTAKRPVDSSLNVHKAMKALHDKPLEIKPALEKLKKEITQQPSDQPPRLENLLSQNLKTTNHNRKAPVNPFNERLKEQFK
jgi:dTDP-4-dehydrorhamnose reductase